MKVTNEKGGVLLPLLWSLVVDDLLRKLKDLIQGYATQLVVMATDRWEKIISGLMQATLNSLDVLLDQELTWYNHINTVIIKVIVATSICRTILGKKLGGLDLKMIYQ